MLLHADIFGCALNLSEKFIVKICIQIGNLKTKKEKKAEIKRKEEKSEGHISTGLHSSRQPKLKPPIDPAGANCVDKWSPVVILRVGSLPSAVIARTAHRATSMARLHGWRVGLPSQPNSLNGRHLRNSFLRVGDQRRLFELVVQPSSIGQTVA